MMKRKIFLETAHPNALRQIAREGEFLCRPAALLLGVHAGLSGVFDINGWRPPREAADSEAPLFSWRNVFGSVMRQ